MSTYTGVIAASQKRCNCGAERLTDLFVQQQYMYLTSRPYALEDEPSSGVFAVSVKESPSTNTVEQSGVTGVAILGGQSSGTWKLYPHDEFSVTGGILSITKTRTTRYGSMSAGHDEFSVTGGLLSITKTRTTRYSSTSTTPDEFSATGGLLSITKTRTSL